MDRSTDFSDLAEIAIPSVGSGSDRSDRSDRSAVPASPVARSVEVAAAPVAVATPVDDPFDYGTDADPDQEAVARAFSELDRITLAAERLTDQHRQAEEHAQKLKTAKEQLLNREIPELLAKMRLDECTTASGIQVKVKREIKASLPGHERVEQRMGALRWLVEHGHGGVIKNQVSVSLDRGDDVRADDLVVELRAKGFDVEAKKDVNHMTLGALVRELMAEGKIIPRENFNIFDMKIAKLTRK
jgi:hypothetical protein